MLAKVSQGGVIEAVVDEVAHQLNLLPVRRRQRAWRRGRPTSVGGCSQKHLATAAATALCVVPIPAAVVSAAAAAGRPPPAALAGCDCARRRQCGVCGEQGSSPSGTFPAFQFHACNAVRSPAPRKTATTEAGGVLLTAPAVWRHAACVI